MWIGDAAVATADLASMYSFFTIAFASFVEAQHDFSQSFSDWLKVRLSRYPLRVAYRRLDVGKNGDLQVSPPWLISLYAHSQTIIVKSCSFASRMGLV
jgi:hypothetical protein